MYVKLVQPENNLSKNSKLEVSKLERSIETKEEQDSNILLINCIFLVFQFEIFIEIKFLHPKNIEDKKIAFSMFILLRFIEVKEKQL